MEAVQAYYLGPMSFQVIPSLITSCTKSLTENIDMMASPLMNILELIERKDARCMLSRRARPKNNCIMISAYRLEISSSNMISMATLMSTRYA